MHTRTRPAAVATLAAAFAAMLLAAAACGGDPEPSEAAAASPTQSPSAAYTSPAADYTAPAADYNAPYAATAAPAPTQAVAAAAATEAPADAPAPAPADAAPRAIGDVDGVTFVVTDESEATFTVGETLSSVPLPIEAVLRTNQLSGNVHLDGRESRVTIDLQTLESDQANRDRWVRSRLFGQHPTGTFVLDDVTPLPPGLTDGDTVNVPVDGTLELLGRVIPMTWDIEARDDGEVLYILGKSSFTWDDIGEPTPTSRAVVSVEDEVRVQVLIVARPA